MSPHNIQREKKTFRDVKITRPAIYRVVKKEKKEARPSGTVISKKISSWARLINEAGHRFLKFVGIFIFDFLFKLEIEGLENVPVSGPAILACSHASFLDPMILFYALPRKHHSIAINWLFKIPVVSWALRVAGSIPAHGSVNGAIATLNKKEMIAIFPAGYCARTREEMTMKPRRGVGVFAMATGAPVVPIAISGTLEAWPTTRLFPRLFRKFKVRIGKPMHFAKYPDAYIPHPVLEKTLGKIMGEIRKLLDDGISGGTI